MRIGRAAPYVVALSIALLLLLALTGPRPAVGPYIGLQDALTDIAALGDRTVALVEAVIGDVSALRAPSPQTAKELGRLEEELTNVGRRLSSTPDSALLGSREPLMAVVGTYLGLVSVGRKAYEAARYIADAVRYEEEGLYMDAVASLDKAEEELVHAAKAIGELDISEYLSQGHVQAISNMERDIERLVDMVRGYKAYMTLRARYGDLLEKHLAASDAFRALGLAAMRGDRAGVEDAARKLERLLREIVSDGRYGDYMALFRAALGRGYVNAKLAEASEIGDPQALLGSIGTLLRLLEEGAPLGTALEGAFGTGAGGAGPRPQG